MTWQRRAACRASPQLFDLDLDVPETTEQRAARHEAARAICATCPVLTECLVDSFENPYGTDGIRASELLDGGQPV